MRVGLTGGIGAGKSEVAAIFSSLGALVIDADDLAREAVAPGSEGLRSIAERWPQVVGPTGELDRAALAALIFSDPNAREQLNAIVHPAVRALATERAAASAPGQIIIQEVPLLFETGFDEACDRTVVVVADREHRIARVMARSDLTRDEIVRRMAAQIDPAEAQRRASFTIRNDGDHDDLRRATTRVWDALRAGAPAAEA
jgi:dephospho-CoA kinase